MEFSKAKKNFLDIPYNINTKIFVLILFFILAITLGYTNFSLYHNLVEIFCIVIGFVMAIISINTYKLNENSRIIFLGISFGFIAFINLLHLFTYAGMNFNSLFTLNASIQLWIITRYTLSISLIISFTSKKKKHNLIKVSIIYLIILMLLLTSIVIIKIFPATYIIGFGFTSFKSIAGGINCAILLVSLIYFNKQNKGTLTKSDSGLKHFIICSILCELFFVLTGDNYHLLNIIAHIFQLLSFYYIYIALIRSSLQEPYHSLIDLNNTLKNKNQILNAILESVADGILVINSNSKVMHANDELIKLLGIPFEITTETNDHKIIDFIKKQIENPNEFEKHIENEWTSNKEYIKNIYLKNGKVIETSSSPFVLNNTTKGRLIIYKDITEKTKIQKLQKQVEIREASLEKAREFDELKTNFFCTVSHELKTPINIILGVIQLLSRGSKDDLEFLKKISSSKYINMMKQNCYRLIKLSNNLIDITKIESDYTQMNIKNHNIVSVIEDITLSVAEYTKSKDLTLIFDTDIEEKIIACDDEKLERVMLNLLSNAIKFTDAKGKIKVNIKDNIESIIISVKDSGLGIPKDKVDLVFDRFSQVDSTLRRQKEGSGIGLALVKSIIEKHGGSISLESELGKGSEFLIELPVKVAIDNEALDRGNEYVETNVDRINIEFSDIYELNIY